MAGALIVVLLAWHSVAYALAFAGLPPVAFALLGSNPFPPGGISLLLAGWIALAVVFVVIRRIDAPPLAVTFSVPLVATVALTAWMAFRLAASAAPEYGLEKLQLFIAGNLAFMVGGLMVGWRPRHLRLLVILVFAVSLAGGAVVSYKFLTGAAETVLPDRFSISEAENPISLGRDSASGLLIGIYLLLTVRSNLMRSLVMAAIPVLVIALVASGSRGPVAGAVGGLGVLAAFAVTSRSARRRLLGVAGAALGSIFIVPLIVPSAAVSRSLEIFSASGGGLSSNGRTGLWGQAVEAFTHNTFFGIGTGGFSAIQVAELYPHNLFLESAAELGVVGLGLVVALVVTATGQGLRAWRSTTDPQERLLAALVLALLATTFVNSLFSGALPDNRVAWLWAGATTGLAARYLAQTAPRERRGFSLSLPPVRGLDPGRP
jgi:O-antigen ligase